MQFDLDFTRRIPPAAQELIHDGMATADEHADHFWKRMIDAAIVAVALRLHEFTVDDVLNEMEKIPNCPSTHALDALGPAMVRARRDKIVTRTDKVIRSRRIGKHGNRHNVWRSNYFQEKTND